MLDDNAMNTRSNEDNTSENYRSHDTNLDKNYIVQWTSPEENKYCFKHRYVSSSRSVPRRNKQFVRYKINRSLNSDVLNIQNSSSDNSSVDGEKYLTRSAKIMRALHFNTSPTYYGRTKIKRSLNFNLTPSPKTFSRSSKNIRRASSLNFATSSPKLSKVLNYDDSPSSSVNSSLVFATSDCIDENQNETPSHQRIKARQSLSYSTPDTKFDKKSPDLSNFTPYLRSTLKEKINNIIYVAATPNQSAKCKSRLKYSDDILVGTPRNLLQDFHDEDNSRPTTPENLVRLIPESMSAIKRSHKKERSSRRSERSEKDSVKRAASEANVEDIKAPNQISPISTSFSQIDRKQLSSMIKLSKKRENWKCSSSMFNSVGEDNLSDTGSIFDYTEEQERILKDELDTSDLASAYNAELLKVEKHEILEKQKNSINLELGGSVSNLKENEPSAEQIASEEGVEIDNKQAKIEVDDEDRWGARTPESVNALPEPSQKPMTPENRLNYLQHVLQDSIKKSHKKIKEDRKKKLFSPKVLEYKIETIAHENPVSMNQLHEEQCKTINDVANDFSVKKENDSMEDTQRACTPEKVSSSRLLLSQFSSVKKSHKKDKHNKILSRFKKRQEYFNRDLEFPAEPMKTKNSEDEVTNKGSLNKSSKEINEEIINLANICFDSEKLSPSKRKKSLDSSLDHNASSVSCDSELQEYDSDKEDFQIFTPLKRKKASAVPMNMEYFSLYKMPVGGEDISQEFLSEVNLTRCLTPVVNFRSNSTKSNGDSEQKRDENNKVEKSDNYSIEPEPSTSNDRNATGGRSTPRNMSTTELYPNVDSIKKSHKKNKRGNRLRKNMGLNESCEAFETKCEEPSFRKSENLPLDSKESIEFCLRDADVPMENACKIRTDIDRNKQNVDKELGSQNVDLPNKEATPIKTPPNCLKTMSYITRLQNTSIKRSHKKVRDKKKHEITVEISDLSDEGSIFGDEERVCSLELDKSSPGSKEQFGLLSPTDTINS